MAKIVLAATQMACSWDRDANIAQAEQLVRDAAGMGAQVILLQELFETPYFCQDQNADYFTLAHDRAQNPVMKHFQALAKELGVVLPFSFFEKAGPAYFNALSVIDADGSVVDHYRKMHIPDGPGYQEKFYFNPGDTGFKVFPTRFGTVGAAICWDQWFPECARSMALAGADMLFYPTAIGTEPHDPTIDSRQHWMRVMQGHAGANLMPLVASNRIGTEAGANSEITFYGSSFIAGPEGEMLALASLDKPEVITQAFDLEEIAAKRAAWGIFRDRRPDYYQRIMTLDGHA
ncbi:MAG: N-carbamoylputrescine amidase, partial [Pseudomonadota bacterium]